MGHRHQFGLGTLLLAVSLAAVGVAPVFAQGSLTPDNGYVSLAGHSSFGNVTSRSFGLEGGWTITPELQLVVEAGHVLDAASPSMGAGAPTIALALGARASGAVTFSFKAPVNFGTAALKYVLPTGGPVQFYVLGGGGVGECTRNATFTVGGADVTNSLSAYHIILGNDLSGSQYRPMVVIGGGAVVPIAGRLFADVNYRYNRIFDLNIPISRAGIGVGVRF
jgi:opacity protein-like surface antigen